MPFRPFSILLFLLLPLLVGCQSVQLKDKQSQLEETLRAYSGTVRWGNLADTYNFLTAELAQSQTPPAGLDEIKVTQYEEMGSPVMKGETQASATARIRYVHQSRQVVRTITDQQLWQFVPGQGWRRSNPIPELK
jgi:hypothetical protein